MGVRHIDAWSVTGDTVRMEDDLGRKRLRQLVDEQYDGDMKAASMAAGLGKTYVRDILKRAKNGRTQEMTKLARQLNVALGYLTGEEQDRGGEERPAKGAAQGVIHIVGKVGAGVWFEVQPAVNVEDFPISVFPPDPRYPLGAQFDLEVVGTSLDKIARDGELLRCVDFNGATFEPQNGDVVIVERVHADGSLVETTAKFYHKLDGRIELRPHSNDPKWQQALTIRSNESADDRVTIKALVLYAYRPVSKAL